MHFSFPELRLFQEWAKNRYGVFPEVGFSGDRLYPEYFDIGTADQRKNEGCNDTLPMEVVPGTETKHMVRKNGARYRNYESYKKVPPPAVSALELSIEQFGCIGPSVFILAIISQSCTE